MRADPVGPRSRARSVRSRACARWAAAALAAVGLAFLPACQDSETPMARGDRLWADSAYTAALAEYRLSHARNRSPEALARVAHGYAVTGQFERAREAYTELLSEAPEYQDQALFDYLNLAEQAEARDDRYSLAGAVEAALAIRPGLPVQRLTPTLARYYAATGAADRAQEYFERALAEAPPDSVPGLLYELARVQQSRGRCREAVELFNSFRERVSSSDPRSDQARYAVGTCSWQLAQSAITAEPERALYLLETVTRLQAPANVQDEAWFQRGEVLLALGRHQEALDAYMRALELARTPRGRLAEQARRRIDDLRFGRIPGDSSVEPAGRGPGTEGRPRT